MRSACFGWGIPLLKRHWSLRWGECPRCHQADFRSSYDASRMAVFLGLPLLPLGKVHMHEHCAVCGRGEMHALGVWENLREEHFIPALERLSQHPGDPHAASNAMQQTVAYGDPDEFPQLAGLIEEQFPENAEILGQLAWCHGHFARFDDARRLFQRALMLDDRPDRRETLQAYAALPQTSPPRRPSAIRQGLRFLILPVLVLAGLTLYLSHALEERVTSVYVVNGLDRAYEVSINGHPVSLAPHGREQLTLSPGAVRVAPASDAFRFPSYQFTLPRDDGPQSLTTIINPDKVAVILWEELVYQNVETSTQPNADQFVLHAGEGFYFFYGITDHFTDPPPSLEIRLKDEETYRHVVHHLANESPVSLCTLLLGQGEMDLAEDYCRRILTLDPEETGLLPFLRELAPNEDTLAFMAARLEDRPVRLHWHRHHLDLAIALGLRAKMQDFYEDLSDAEPANGDLHFLLGQTRKDPEAAQADYRRAAEHGSAEAMYELSLRASGLGEFEQAFAHIQEALQSEPENTLYQAQKEDLQLATGRYDDLILPFRRRLYDDPLDQETALTLAGLYELTGRPDDAQAVADRFIRAITRDGSLRSEATAPHHRLFASVRAQWAGDVDRFIASSEGVDDAGGINVLILQGKYADAAAAIHRSSSDPFLQLLLYALASKEGVHLALAEVQLSQALTLFDDQGPPDFSISTWFRKGANAPSIEETLRARLPNHHRRVLLFALAQRHPDAATPYLALAKKLNYNRVFPYLALSQALEGLPDS